MSIDRFVTGRALAPSLRGVAALAAALVWTCAAHAQSPDREPPDARASEVGHATAAWLDLQASNREAAPEAAPMSGAAATLAYQRYLDSFRHPVPDTFESKLSGSGSGGVPQ
jgi:hypothetical protein